MPSIELLPNDTPASINISPQGTTAKSGVFLQPIPPTCPVHPSPHRMLAPPRLAALLLLLLCILPKVQAASRTQSGRAALAVSQLQAWYNPDTGLYRTTGWWNSANAITALADYAHLSGTHEFDSVFANTFTAAQKSSPGFLNNFYDDEGWWALAWIDVYTLNHDPRYLTMARSIFENMSASWDQTCSGGIWWSKDRNYKNAIANELFLEVAAQLANQSASSDDRSKYLDWAAKEWAWFHNSGMINSDNLVNDGLDSTCANNHKTTWTYNQGVLIGGLVSLNQLTTDPGLIAQAQSLASASITRLTDSEGILHESCEPDCGADGTQFKGIFLRNLRTLDRFRPKPSYHQFVRTNAESVWKQVKSRPAASHAPATLGPLWSAPYGTPDASSQSSAIDLLITASQDGPGKNHQGKPSRQH